MAFPKLVQILMKEGGENEKVATSLGAVVAAIGSLVSIAANIFDLLPSRTAGFILIACWAVLLVS
jgi:hypothetical protein